MLQVRAGSWHYWIWSLGRRQSSRPKNLCLYFWHCTFKILAALTIFGLAFAGIGALAYLVWSFPFFFSGGLIGLVVIGLAVWVGGYLFGAWYDRHMRRKDEKRDRRAALPPKPPKPVKPPGTMSLIWTFIKAKKKKYCPLIQVVDE